jgi:hypothetical protein
MAIAIRIGGKAKRASTQRLMTASIQLPENPAKSPSGRPTSVASPTETTAILNETRVP